jgi:uncharacterized SAM-binding protein YcdF (DUF218 family)
VYELVRHLFRPELWIFGCLIAALLCLRAPHRIKTARRLLIAAVILFYVLSIQPGSNVLLYGLESKFTQQYGHLQADADAIIVLAGGVRGEPVTGHASVVGTDSLDRMICGIVLWRDGVAPTMIVTGGLPGPVEATPAYAMQQLAVRLGVPADAIQIEVKSRTTLESANELRSTMPELKRIALVSSAYHLTRANRAFETRGFQVAAVPCNYLSSSFHWGISSFLPSGRALDQSYTAIHEYVGLAAYHVMEKL